jgi:hypothetical protein
MKDGMTNKTVFWHRDLPPVTADVIGEAMLEADSIHVSGRLADRDRLWDRCLADLKTETERRLEQEIRRCGGQYAHVLSEITDTRRDDTKDEVWLHAIITYVLLRQSQGLAPRPIRRPATASRPT